MLRLLKRIFGFNNQVESTDKEWTMFSSSKEELKEMMVDLGEVTFKDNNIEIKDYPFKPSVLYFNSIIQGSNIHDINLKSRPLTINISNNELVFIAFKHKENLEEFAIKNKIPIIERPRIWEWILEPFLDTEFTNDSKLKVTKNLKEYALNEEVVESLRNEVKIQMYKYNFDTMLWEWISLDACDVLLAIRPKYKEEKFKEFYFRVMKIALSAKK